MLIHGQLNVHEVRFLCAQGQQKFFCPSDEQSLLMNTIDMFKYAFAHRKYTFDGIMTKSTSSWTNRFC